MNTKPDSALTILNSIHASGFKGKDAARYALLKSMALDKNCIDTTTFDILEPAIDYYIKTELQTNSFGHIIIKAGFIRIKVMTILQCSLL